MKLRKYIDSDANEILKWIKTEKDFKMWSANRYDSFPITPAEMNLNYFNCSSTGTFFPMTLIDIDKIVGHIVLRYPTDNKDIIRFGFIIINNTLRGKGYGKLLIKEAIKYAKDVLLVKEITLGVFENNTNAYHCYKSVGFKETSIEKNILNFGTENWNCIEMKLEVVYDKKS